MAGADSLEPVRWRLVDEAAQGLAVRGRTLVFSNWSDAGSCPGWLSAYRVSRDGDLEQTGSTLEDCTPLGSRFTNIVAAPTGLLYYLEGGTRVLAARVGAEGDIVPADLMPPIETLDACWDPWDSSLVPLRNVLGMACSTDRSLTTAPTDLEQPPPPTPGNLGGSRSMKLVPEVALFGRTTRVWLPMALGHT